MKILLEVSETIYDCHLQICDQAGSRSLLFPATEAPSQIWIDLHGSDAELTFLPAIPDADHLLQDAKATTLKDKFINKAAGKLSSFFSNLFLLVGCRFRLPELHDGDRLTVRLQSYAFGTFDRLGLLGLYPLVYMFFEISHGTGCIAPEAAWSINRKKILRHVKTFEMLNFDLFSLIFCYPFQMGRIRHLSRNRTVNKKVLAFSKLPEQKRQAFLQKQMRYFNS